MTLGTRIKSARRNYLNDPQEVLSQKTLAHLVNTLAVDNIPPSPKLVTARMISDFERDILPPSRTTMRRIERVLNLPDHFLDRDPERELAAKASYITAPILLKDHRPLVNLIPAQCPKDRAEKLFGCTIHEGHLPKTGEPNYYQKAPRPYDPSGTWPPATPLKTPQQLLDEHHAESLIRFGLFFAGMLSLALLLMLLLSW